MRKTEEELLADRLALFIVLVGWIAIGAVIYAAGKGSWGEWLKRWVCFW